MVNLLRPQMENLNHTWKVARRTRKVVGCNGYRPSTLHSDLSHYETNTTNGDFKISDRSIRLKICQLVVGRKILGRP